MKGSFRNTSRSALSGIPQKRYRAVIFDWDGTAVPSRTAPIDDVLPLMVRLLSAGMVLIIISGTTYENIAGGTLHHRTDRSLLGNLYLGLGRGAFDYGFENGKPVVLHEFLPDDNLMREIHRLAFDFHMRLLAEHGYPTDIVFSRPNYCKVDLLVRHERGDKLYLDAMEIDAVNHRLRAHGYEKGIRGLLDGITEMGRDRGLAVKATTDAKYLEVGLTTKEDNIVYFLSQVVMPKGIQPEECAFWGDEFGYLADGVRGSDAHMITEVSRNSDFFDVSGSPLALPDQVRAVSGGVRAFLRFLEYQADLVKR